MKNLIIFLALFICCSRSSAQTGEKGCLKANIFFLLDWSASFDYVKMRSVEPMQRFLNTFELDDRGVKVAIILFGNDDTIWSELTSSEEILKSKIRELDLMRQFGNTYVEESFPTVSKMIKEDREERNEDVLNLIILVSDGGFSRPADAFREAEFMRLSNQISPLIISTIFIYSGDVDENNLKKIADENFHFWEYEFGLLVEMIRKLNICL